MILMPFLPGVGFPRLPNTAGSPKTYLAGKRGWREEARPLLPGVGAVGADWCRDPLYAGVCRCVGDLPVYVQRVDLLLWWIAQVEEG